MVEKGWQKGAQRPLESPQKALKARLKGCASELAAWGKTKRGNYPLRIGKACQHLQETIVSGGDVHGARLHLENLLGEEEIYWRQRARVEWLQWGDRNSRWFHQRATQRRKYNHMEGLMDANGDYVQEEEGMVKVISAYFNEVFASNQKHDSVELQWFLDHVQPGLDVEAKAMLNMRYTEEELLVALKQMHPTKAPGEDGFPALLYQKY